MSDEQHNHSDRADGPGLGDARSGTASAMLKELCEHIPFSVTAVAIGLTVAGTICILGSGFMDVGIAEDHSGHDHGDRPQFGILFFHLFHPAHMFFSAAATAAMFRRYDRNPWKAIVVGLVGAIGVCGISDIAMPHCSLALLGAQTEWHICVLENPVLVLPFAGIGVLVGVTAASGVIRSTLISHSLHVLASTMASIFYMVGPLGAVAWIDRVGEVFLFVVLAVMVPCCISDIVFPMFMSHAGRAKYLQEPHACH